jgi:hypothetical protein
MFYAYSQGASRSLKHSLHCCPTIYDIDPCSAVPETVSWKLSSSTHVPMFRKFKILSNLLKLSFYCQSRNCCCCCCCSFIVSSSTPKTVQASYLLPLATTRCCRYSTGIPIENSCFYGNPTRSPIQTVGSLP